MLDSLVLNPDIDTVSSNRIIYTPSIFARYSLIHLQETGTLQATHPHKNERSGLSSCLFFTVLRGSGQLTYDGAIYVLHSGDCVFIDCKKPYSHETGSTPGAGRHNIHSLSCERIMVPLMGSLLRPEHGRYLPQVSGVRWQAGIPDELVKLLPRHPRSTVQHRILTRLCPGHADPREAVLSSESPDGRRLE